MYFNEQLLCPALWQQLRPNPSVSLFPQVIRLIQQTTHLAIHTNTHAGISTHKQMYACMCVCEGIRLQIANSQTCIGKQQIEL